MDIETQIRAWKDAKFRSTLNSEELLPNPAGSRLVEINEDEIRAVWGAMAPNTSEGYVCSVSGACNRIMIPSVSSRLSTRASWVTPSLSASMQMSGNSSASASTPSASAPSPRSAAGRRRR